MKFETVTQSFSHANEIAIIENGKETVLQKGDEKFEEILASLEAITTFSHDMPAFGVSIDKETRKELLSKTWIELRFSNTLTCNDLPFDALLINVEKGFSGFNLIRKYNNKYDGRCFYLDLSGDMSKLYQTVKAISKN